MKIIASFDTCKHLTSALKRKFKSIQESSFKMKPLILIIASAVSLFAINVNSNENGTCNIKGNISYNTGEKIYHVKGQKYYEKTKINENKGEKYFCSEEEAKEQGWRKSQS